jgi:hypothetical protein
MDNREFLTTKDVMDELGCGRFTAGKIMHTFGTKINERQYIITRQKLRSIIEIITDKEFGKSG